MAKGSCTAAAATVPVEREVAGATRSRGDQSRPRAAARARDPRSWGSPTAAPAQCRPRLLQPMARLGAGLSVEDAGGTNRGDAQHRPARHPSAPRLRSASPADPKPPAPTRTGTHRPGSPENTLLRRGVSGSDDPRAGAGLGPAPQHPPGVQPPQEHPASLVFRTDAGSRRPTPRPGSGTPRHSCDGSAHGRAAPCPGMAGKRQPLPSQAGTAAPVTAFAYAGIFLRSSN